MFIVSGLAMYNMQGVVHTEESHALTFAPAIVLATDFERELFNARIFFIYFVTIQKPGSLDAGMERYRNAKLLQQELVSMVGQHEELSPLRPGVAKVGEDLTAYSLALQSSLTMVQNGVTSGPVYEAQVKDWAAQGAVMVADAGKVEALCAAANADSTKSMTDRLKSSCKGYALLFAAGAPLMIFLVWKLVSKMNEVLHDGVAELTEASVQIASAANQIALSSKSQAEAASQQAATIEETSSASVEINSMAMRTTENSRTTANLMAHSEETLGKTNQSLTEMVEAMDRINGSSQKISKIIKVIDEIAFQTNILALNAAVEAARAGEAGLGFAVVADEVRNLAQRCAQAARDTTDLIEESIQSSDEGRAKVDQVGNAISAITSESLKIKVLVDEINSGSLEQSRGIDQISHAIAQMEQATQSSAASAEEGSAAAEQLRAHASSMRDVVERMNTLVDGKSRPSGQRPDELAGRVHARLDLDRVAHNRL
jgi:methyl-accepting chemotaxis protein